MNDKKQGKLPLLLIFLTVFIDLIGFGIIIPILPLYAEKFHADALTVGLLLMSYSAMQFFFAPFWGRLSDKVGRRPILMISLAASGIGYLIWGFSGSLAMLFLSRIVAGFGNANLAVAQAYIADVTSEENRAGGMAVVGIAFGLGFILGPAIGGICSAVGLGAATVGFIAAAFSFLDLLFTAFALPEPPNRSQAAHERFVLDPGFYVRTITDHKLAAPLAIFFISTFAFSNMETTLVLLTERTMHFDMKANSLLFTYIGFVMILVQGGMVRRFSKKYGEKPLIMAGTLLIGVGLLLTPVSSNLTVLLTAVALLAIGSGLNTPSNQSIISKLADQKQVGGVMGVSQSVSTLGRILGPVAGGYLFDHMGMSSPYIFAAGCMCVAFLLSFGLPKTKPALAAVADNTSSSSGGKAEPVTLPGNAAAELEQTTSH